MFRLSKTWNIAAKHSTFNTHTLASGEFDQEFNQQQCEGRKHFFNFFSFPMIDFTAATTETFRDRCYLGTKKYTCKRENPTKIINSSRRRKNFSGSGRLTDFASESMDEISHDYWICRRFEQSSTADNRAYMEKISTMLFQLIETTRCRE